MRAFLQTHVFALQFVVTVMGSESVHNDSSIATPTPLASSTTVDVSTVTPTTRLVNIVKENPSLDVGPLTEVTVARGDTARLPCNHLMQQSNKPKLVLWYKNDTTRPFISYDGRKHKSNSEKISNTTKNKYKIFLRNEKKDQNKLKKRLSLESAGQTLIIAEIQKKDQAEYRCKIHFSHLPSLTRRLQLMVVDSAHRVQLLDSEVHPVGTHVGPLSEGSQLFLSCKVFFSCPLIKMEWLVGEDSVNSNWQTLEDGLAVSNFSLVLDSNYSQAIVTCRLQCKNSHSADANTSIFDASTTILMHYVPKVALLVESFEKSLRKELPYKEGMELTSAEGLTVTFLCTVRARPPAYKIAWLQNGKKLKLDVRKWTKYNTTLVVSPVRREDSGLYTCVASNAEGDGQSNAVSLKVTHAPYCINKAKSDYIVIRHEPATIACEFEAVPSNLTFTWTFDPPQPIPKAIEKPSPNIQHYTPFPTLETATNGNVEEEQSNHHLAKSETDEKNSRRAYLTFIPMIDGQGVVCFAKNRIGRTQVPCAYKLKVVDRPKPPEKCQLEFSNEVKLQVSCEGAVMPASSSNNQQQPSPGISYVLSPEARTISHLEVWRGDTLLSNVTNKTPLFDVGNLPRASAFELKLYSSTPFSKSAFVQYRVTNKGALKDSISAKTNRSEDEHSDFGGLVYSGESNFGRFRGILIFFGVAAGGIGFLLFLLFATICAIRRKVERTQRSDDNSEDGISTPGTIAGIISIAEQESHVNSPEVPEHQETAA